MNAGFNQTPSTEVSETGKPVEIVQELIAIHTTRIEAATRLGPLASTTLSVAIITQSKKYVEELMEELSNFGDAVQSTVNRENEFQHTWKEALTKVDSLSKPDCEAIQQNMEAILKTFYQEVISGGNALPASVMQLLHKQSLGIETDLQEPPSGPELSTSR